MVPYSRRSAFVRNRLIAETGGGRGAITSDAGALLLGETNRAVWLTGRFVRCFTDARVAKLVGTRSAPWCCSGLLAYRWATKN